MGGESVFNGNCTACHAGGNNTVSPEKKLKKEAIEKYLTGGYNIEAIKYQVTNGKNSMPAFGEKLGPDDIEDVANYVFNQADKWPRDALPRLTSRTRGQRRPRGGEERLALGP